MGIVPAVVYNPASPLAGTYMALNLTGSTALYLSDSLLLHLQDTSLSSANLQALKWPSPEAPASRWADTISCAPFNWSFPASGTWYDLPQGPWGLVALRDEDTVNSGSQLCFFCRAEVSEHDHGEGCPIFNYLFTGVRELQHHGRLEVNGRPLLLTPQHPPLHVLQRYAFSMLKQLGPHHLYLLLQNVPQCHPCTPHFASWR